MSIDFRKILGYQNFMKSVQCEPNCSMRADKHDKTNSRLSHFCEYAEKKGAGKPLIWHF